MSRRLASAHYTHAPHATDTRRNPSMSPVQVQRAVMISSEPGGYTHISAGIERGVEVSATRCNTAETTDLSGTVVQALGKKGPHGLWHCAGMLEDAMLASQAPNAAAPSPSSRKGAWYCSSGGDLPAASVSAA